MIVIATRNPGKAKEFSSIFGEKGYTVKTLLDYPNLPDVEETGRTFEENARLKAETIAEILQKPVLADDSGLIVDALGGMPGIYSARFAGEPTNDASNNAKLLHELTGVPKEKRQARFHCTLVLLNQRKKVWWSKLNGQEKSVRFLVVKEALGTIHFLCSRAW